MCTYKRPVVHAVVHGRCVPKFFKCKTFGRKTPSNLALEPQSQPETNGCSNMAMEILYTIGKGCFGETSISFWLFGVPGHDLTGMEISCLQGRFSARPVTGNTKCSKDEAKKMPSTSCFAARGSMLSCQELWTSSRSSGRSPFLRGRNEGKTSVRSFDGPGALGKVCISCGFLGLTSHGRLRVQDS